MTIKETTRVAFTMAEILLSLTIIGVVAAITLPSLTGNINERTWNTQRKALYARMSQAISLMPALNGYGEVKEASSEGASDAVDTATETFLTAGLSKVLKINNICDNEHLADCGIVTSYTNMSGNPKTMPTTLFELSSYFQGVTYAGCSYKTTNTKAVAFETQNGESIVTFYNPSCRTQYLNEEAKNASGESFGFGFPTICLNFIYDLNGSKGPNTFGKDIGVITVFNATDSNVVAPMPASAADESTSVTWYNAATTCRNSNPDSRLPNIDELTSLAINKDSVGLIAGVYWSSSVLNNSRAWCMSTGANGERVGGHKGGIGRIRCVKR